MYFVLYLSKDLKIEVFRAKGLAQIFCNDVWHVWLGKGHSCSYWVGLIEMSKARHRIHIFSGPFIQPLPKDSPILHLAWHLPEQWIVFSPLFIWSAILSKLDIAGQACHCSIVKNQKLYIRKKYRWCELTFLGKSPFGDFGGDPNGQLKFQNMHELPQTFWSPIKCPYSHLIVTILQIVFSILIESYESQKIDTSYMMQANILFDYVLLFMYARLIQATSLSGQQRYRCSKKQHQFHALCCCSIPK